jgi:serine/threonine-protein kinase
MLLERPGEVVTREQLNARLWPNGTIVEFDHGINSCIRRLRAALNDSAEQPRFIETLPKRGYRFIFPCEFLQRKETTAKAPPTAQYRVVAKLGAGAMGVVYRATDTRLGRDVALKFPVESILDSPRLMDAFEREARAAAALNHPNICTVHCVGEQDGRPFIAMELLEGETLEAILNRREFSIDEVLTIASQIAMAMDAAHSRGIIHRDIKPANIFISAGNAVKVVDFGISKCSTAPIPAAAPAEAGLAAPALSTIAGTPRYMSPEQLEGRAADVRSDIFSFGVTLYEMITRRRPFAGEKTEELLASIQSAPPPRLAGVPSGLVRLIDGCLQAEPGVRWQTAHELVTQLRSISAVRRWPKSAWAATAAVVVLAAWTWFWRQGNTPAIHSIAVLPFTIARPNADTEYLTDGVTEAIINSLSAAPRLKVIARTTAFSFKDKTIDPQAVGRQLGVGAVLTGRISQRGDWIDIQTDLVNVADGSQLWGEHFRRSVGDIQRLQADIAGEITDKLRLRLAGEERKRVTRRYTQSSEAFQLYLKAMHLPSGPFGLEERVKLLEQATAKDPGFARAYVQLAYWYRLLGGTLVWPATKSLQKSREAVTRALELDPDFGEAHVELAANLWWKDWDWAGADREFRRALELNATSAHMEYGWFLAMIGRTEEARIEARRAIEIDPLSPWTLIVVSLIHWSTRDYSESLEDARRAGGEAPMTLEAMGRYEEAIASYEKSVQTVANRGHLGRCYALAGRQTDARRILGELQAGVRKNGLGAYEIAFIHAALGNKNEAFRSLDLAYQQRDSGIKFLKVDPALDVLRSDARFQELERRVGPPQ